MGTVIKTGWVFFAAVPLGNLARALAISQLFLALMNHLEVQDIRLLRRNLVTTTPFELIPPFSHSDIQQAISHISSWSWQNLYQLNPSRIPADHAPDRTLFPRNNNYSAVKLFLVSWSLGNSKWRCNTFRGSEKRIVQKFLKNFGLSGI